MEWLKSKDLLQNRVRGLWRGKIQKYCNVVKEIYSVESIPEDVAPIRYCYNNEENFYLNPRYKENYSLEEKVSALEDAVNLLLGF